MALSSPATGAYGALPDASLASAVLQVAIGTVAEQNGPERMSVNVSARQLAEPGFCELVASVPAWSGMPAHQPVVEVTETAEQAAEPGFAGDRRTVAV